MYPHKTVLEVGSDGRNLRAGLARAPRPVKQSPTHPSRACGIGLGIHLVRLRGVADCGTGRRSVRLPLAGSVGGKGFEGLDDFCDGADLLEVGVRP